ncbi:MAG: LysM repeat protein [Saprospiraceae bacterium]|jgi:LysM repeat protein
MKLLFYLYISVIISLPLSAQKDLRVYKVSGERLMTNVTVQPGFTVYSLTKAIGISEADFVVANPGLSTIALELNTSISIPINTAKISTEPLALQNPIKLMYTVGEGETLFSICSVYAHQNISEIMQLNNKSNNELSINETILLGYIDWPYGDVPPTVTIIPELNIEDESMLPEFSTERISLVSESDLITKEIPNYSIDSLGNFDPQELSLSNHIKMSKGIAFWDHRSNSETDLVVMHPRAKVDSKIALYNPMLKRSVEATVVGTIPRNAYPNDANIIISPSVAEALGALDQRFMVEMTYVDKD